MSKNTVASLLDDVRILKQEVRGKPPDPRIKILESAAVGMTITAAFWEMPIAPVSERRPPWFLTYLDLTGTVVAMMDDQDGSWGMLVDFELVGLVLCTFYLNAKDENPHPDKLTINPMNHEDYPQHQDMFTMHQLHLGKMINPEYDGALLLVTRINGEEVPDGE